MAAFAARTVSDASDESGARCGAASLRESDLTADPSEIARIGIGADGTWHYFSTSVRAVAQARPKAKLSRRVVVFLSL